MTPLRLAAALALALAAALPAAAATVTASEGDVKNADFGENPNQATLFDASVRTLRGRQNRNQDSDFFSFGSLDAEVTAIEIDITNPGGAWGGLNLRIKDSPFKNKNDWWPLLHQASIGGVSAATPHSIRFVLDEYRGPLHFALDFYDADFRNGDGLRYEIRMTGAPDIGPDPAAPAVPLPASLPLAAAGLGLLALLRRRRA